MNLKSLGYSFLSSCLLLTQTSIARADCASAAQAAQEACSKQTCNTLLMSPQQCMQMGDASQQCIQAQIAAMAACMPKCQQPPNQGSGGGSTCGGGGHSGGNGSGGTTTTTTTTNPVTTPHCTFIPGVGEVCLGS